MSEPKQQPTPLEVLIMIQRMLAYTNNTLQSIKSMLTFLVVVVILALVVQACTALLSFR